MTFASEDVRTAFHALPTEVQSMWSDIELAGFKLGILFHVELVNDAGRVTVCLRNVRTGTSETKCPSST